MKTAVVYMWLPRADEHDLAASLGMCEHDPASLKNRLETAKKQAAIDTPDADVHIRRWHVWRVVRAMIRVGVTNTPDGRARAYATLGLSEIRND